MLTLYVLAWRAFRRGTWHLHIGQCSHHRHSARGGQGVTEGGVVKQIQ